MLKIALVARLTLLLLIALSTLVSGGVGAGERPAEDNLTREFAQARKRQVRAVDYELHFKFEKGREDFSGTTVLKLELAELDAPLSIDFLGKEIRSVKVNGKAVKDFRARKGSFDLPKEVLAPETRVEIEYVGEFNKEGMSFQRVVDPEDQSEYLYSDFEPYYAHGLFPCLDQPDLKARFDVTVEGPKEWKVISNDLVESTRVDGPRVTTHFHTSKTISTYLFFLGTGPFAEWQDKLDDLPLFIYTRKSLAKYVDAENLFATAKKGLQFYGDYFGFKYPFPKFGEVYIPEFNWGGMENPGAIALNERNIFRGTVTQAERYHRDGLILHEMAHMWFGDLVTMSWWNDLWLNESFATYAAGLAQDRGMGFKGTWQEFFSEKTWGYWQDQLVTTHPIETDVPDIRTVKSNFDGITYAKGGAALKQLHFFVGEDGFRNGLRAYFKEFAFQNATRRNFISAIAKASKIDLGDWTAKWLQTAGPNRVQAHWKCEGGKLSAFSIHQEPSSSHTLSPHRTRIGLYRIQGGTWTSLRSLDAAYAQADNPVAELIGGECPDFVYPNLDDEDYALFSLDPVSLRSAKIALTASPDPLFRLMIWNALEQMVRDTQLKVQDYFTTVLSALETEADDPLLSVVLGRYGALRSFVKSYLTPAQRRALAPRLEGVALKRMLAAKPGSSAQLLFFEFYVVVAQTPDALARLQGMLAEKPAPGVVPEGIQIDQDRRWDILARLASQGHVTGKVIDAEEKRDPSVTGKRNAYVAHVALPELANKRRAWKEFQTPDKIPPSTLRDAVGKFHLADHPELSEPFRKPFFDKVLTLDWNSSDALVEIYFESLFPGALCSKSLLKESEADLKKATNLTSIARRSWLEANDELGRCIRVRKKAQE